ncbi:helicase associated domain-containing protein [Paeniglutamicibacter antarcticus]|uniref:Helicase associated domain-containing protein n=1 Tax=Arthrobacter terrae TaxID=2935737 RepID=A0A931CL58_9MICC|nr:Helicase associated domain protein [Arthrobacter terrae]MBG0738977.1 helicase associated domain-containing protein [Arthrobacter terrae]
MGERILPHRRTLLDGRLPGWNKSAKDVWHARLDEVCVMVETLGRIPRSTEKELRHRTASTWLKAHRSRADDDWRVVTLNERLPGWDESPDKLWDDQLAAVVAFVAANGSLPHQREKDGKSRTLGSWISTQRKAGALSEYRRAELDRQLPGWAKDFNDVWEDSLKYVTAFYNHHGRFPRVGSSDPIEVKNARWIVMQRKLARSMSPERLKKLDEQLPQWRTKRNERWRQNLGAVADYFATHGGPPSSRSKDRDVAYLGRWWQHRNDVQQRNPERDALMDELTPGWRC